MRDINSATKAATTNSHIDMLYLCELDWPDGMVRLHTGIGALMYQGQEYLGSGNLGKVGDITDNAEKGRHQCLLTLSGLDDAQVAQAIEHECYGRSGVLRIGFLDKHSRLDEAAVHTLFAGDIDQIAIDKGEKNSLSVTLTSDNLERAQRLSARYNDESHQRRHSGDRFFRYVTAMVDRPFYWGSDKDAIPLKGEGE